MDTTEKLREVLLDLEESRKREQQQRKISETLLAGLHAIVLARNPDEIFRELLDVLREPLDFEAAFVLRENSDGTLTATASSDPSFADAVWQPQAMFERAFAGQPVAVYDTELVDEWRSLPDPVRQRARSALHFAIHASEPRALFICTHSQRAHFSQLHVALARRFSVLATQALQKIEYDFEITDLKQAQERIKHLNLVLRAVRNVNQLITQEKDRDRLLQGACDILTEDRGCANAWIVLLDEKQRATATAESGLGASFEPMAEQLSRGELTYCGKAALDLGGAIVKDPVTECADCPLASGYSGRTGVSVRLEHEGKVHGLISVSVPGEFAQDAEEWPLFKEVAGDIAFALHSIEVEDNRKKAEELLQRSEARLRQIIDIVPHMIFAKDRDGRFILANKAVADGCGTTPENIVGKTHPELSGATPEQYESYLTDDREVIDSGKVKSIPEEDYTHPDGHKVIMETTKIPFTSAGIPAVLGVSIDITERKKAEKALKESNAKFQQVVSNITAIVWKADIAGDGTFMNTYTSPVADELLELPAGTLHDDWDKYFRYIKPEYLERVNNAFREAIKSPGKLIDCEYEVLKENGQTAWFHSKGRCFEKDGKRHVFGSTTDITERKKAEEALQKSEEKYRLLADNSIDMIWQMDLKLVFTYASPSIRNVMGYTVEEWVGTRLSQHASTKEFFNMARKAIYAIKNYKKFRYLTFEAVMLKKDGTEIPVEITGKLLLNKKGLPMGLQGTTHDITERKQAEKKREKLEQQLRQQQKLESIGTMASGVAHEINNPINGIMNYAQLISDRLEETSPLKEYSGEIIKESERVSVIVRNLLAFARDEKQTHSSAEIFDIVESALSLMRTVIRRDQITLEVDVPDDLSKVKCRSQRIQQVLMNLLSNARDALNEKYPEYHEDKILRVTVQQLDKDGRRWLRTTVEDHGTGIPEEIRGRLLDPFFTTKPREKGTGLGLSISYGIVQDHHGELIFESKPGEFTRVHLDLPIDNGWSLEGETESDH